MDGYDYFDYIEKPNLLKLSQSIRTKLSWGIVGMCIEMTYFCTEIPCYGR